MPSSVGGQWTDFREPSLSARFPSSSWLSIESPSTLWTEIRWAAKHRVRDDAGLSLLSWDGTRWACTAYAVLTHDSQRGQCATGRAVLNRLSTATGGPMSRGLDTQPSATTIDLEDVIRLFDSILKGYPVGSLLLWVRPAPEQTIRLGALKIPAPNTDRAFWVVDGQQRITSLANALDEDGASDPRFALAYDLRIEKFVPRPATDDSKVIPLPVVFDLQRVLRWFADHPEVADYLDRATAVTKTLRQFKIPAYQVRQGDVRTLTDIFDRMNNYGKRLSRAEIFSALFAGDEGAKDDRLTIERIADDINTDLGFGLIDNDTVLRAILARRGPDVAREIRIEFDDQERRGPIEFPGEDRDTAYQAGEDALRRAVQFLQSKGGVPHLSMLAYRYLLIVLSRLFAHHPELDDRNLQLLRRWYWRAAVVGPGFFKGHILGATSSLCSKIKPNDLLSSIQGLLEAVDQKDAPIPSLNRFRTNEASTKITLCAWWHLEPRSPRSGQLYDRAQLSELLNGRTTAADAVRYIVSRRQVPKTYRLWAANRILIPTEDEPVDEIASLLVQRPLELAEESWASVLRSHGMDHEMTALLADGKVVDFLEARQAMLRDDLRRFLQRMCEWGFEDTPSLSELVVEDLDGEDLDIEGDDETR